MFVGMTIGAAIGALAGLLGIRGRCAGGSCPVQRNRWTSVISGVLLGAIAGGLIGSGCQRRAPSAMVREITDTDQFNKQVLAAQGPVMVDFYATWCRPCHLLEPVLDSVADQYKGRVEFVRLDAEKFADLSRLYKIEGYPTVLMFRNGQVVKQWLGLQERPQYVAGIAAELERPATAPTTQAQTQSEGGQTMARHDQTAGSVTMKGKKLDLTGQSLSVGNAAPDFTAVANDMSDFHLSDLAGEVVLVASVPSLDTSVCATETRHFNEEAAKLGGGITVLTVSMDLPFAQKRWCGAEGISAVKTVSDYRDADFGHKYGLLIEPLRLLARAVLVVDRGGTIRYIQVVDEVANEPDYAAALAAARTTAGQ